MQDSCTLDETDHALINVLQVTPRAHWTDVGRAIGINAATAARRWKRITDSGLARVICYPRLDTWAVYRCMAIVEVDCEPATRDQVVDQLARMPPVASVTIASSGRDLYLTVLTPGLAALSDLVLRGLNRLTGIRGTRTHLITRLFGEGAKWRLGALDGRQRAAVPEPDRPASHLLPEKDRDLLMALADGRRTFAELATLTSASVSTARRRVDRAVRDGTLTFRCETAQSTTGWPVHATFWTRVPPDQLHRIATGLVTRPEIRICAAVTGADNLVIGLWLQSLADIQRFEEDLARSFPAISVTDRAICLRAVKRMGCRLDIEGRSVEVIPIDPWAASGLGAL
jgi:DNA-binding Lrp family transcriptional regulator